MKKLFSFVTMLLCVVASAFAQSAVSLTPSDVADIKAADDAYVVQSTTDGLIVNFVRISGGKFTDQLSAYGGANVGLVKFDLSSIPGGATITGATISCDAYCTVATKNSEIIFASVSTDWDGSTVTWNNFNENNSASQIASSGWTENGPTKSSKSLTVTDQVNAALENNVVAFAIYTSTGREHNVSNIHLDVTYVEGAVSKYNYTVNAVTSGASGPLKTLAEGEGTNGVATTVTYPFMIEVGGKYYKLVDSSSFSVDVTNSTPVNIEYEAVENVVAYGEAESSAGSQLSTEGNYSAGRLGNFAANNLAAAFTLPAGSYMFNVAYADRGDRGIYLRDASNSDRNADVIGLVEGIAKTTPAGMYSIEFSLKEETAIAITGWTYTETKTNQSAEMDYYYVVKTGDYVAPKDYTITYVVDGVNTTATFTEGTAVTPIADPVKEGYEFKGWVPAIPETLTEDITVTAQFEKIIVNYDVTLFAGEGGSVCGEGQFAERSTVTIEAIADDDYDFVGWFSGALLVSKDAYYSFELNGNTNLTAKFEKKAPATEPMDITVSQIGYNTLTAAKNIDIAGSGLKAYIASSASGNTIKLTSVEKLVAGNAYFIVGTASKTYTVTATAEEFDAPANNYFVPVSETVTIGEKNGAYTNCYLGVDKNGENPGFYMVDGQINISAGKAYLSAPIENATASIIFEFEDEDATIVINAAADAKIANGAYSIDGMAVKSAKGIIVKDGKKFIVK